MANPIKQQGLALICTLGTIALLIILVQDVISTSPNHPQRHDLSHITQAHENWISQSLIKGYSHANELGNITCPDENNDGIADSCKAATKALQNGKPAHISRVFNGGITLHPNHSSKQVAWLKQWVDGNLGLGNDNALTTPTTNKPLLAKDGQQLLDHIVLAWSDQHPYQQIAWESTAPEDSNLKLPRRYQQHRNDIEQRLKSTFNEQLNLSARNQQTTVNSDWAFKQNLHLKFNPNGLPLQFTPLISGCQCNCTKTRCRCQCNEVSQWASDGQCVSASDAGLCRNNDQGAQCQAGKNQACYFNGNAWLENRWTVSLYSPRAVEGKSCRPIHSFSCPLTPKSGSTCACQFDWPKPLTAERLAQLQLQITNGKPRSIWVQTP
jgi:hypothetical protein